MKFRSLLFVLFIACISASCNLPSFSSEDEKVSYPIPIAFDSTPNVVEAEDATLTLITTPVPFMSENKPKEDGTSKPVESSGIRSNYLYGIQPGNPIRISSWMHDCNWMGVAGQVFDADGTPVENLVVEAGGTLAGQMVLGLSITGIDNGVGPGGYVIKLADQLLESKDSVWVQLKDAAGQALSPRVFIDTTNTCDENLVLLNFLEGAASQEIFVYYYPIIFR